MNSLAERIVTLYTGPEYIFANGAPYRKLPLMKLFYLQYFNEKKEYIFLSLKK